LQSDNVHTFHVELSALEKGHTLGKVRLDGNELHGVRSVSVNAGYHSATEITLTMIASVDVTVNGVQVTEIKG
jgi:hypothetical protein